MQAGCKAGGFEVDFWVFFLGVAFWAADESCACNWLAMKLARRRAEERGVFSWW